MIVFWWQPQFARWLAFPWLAGVGVATLIAATTLVWKKIISPRFGYDLILWSSLLIWLVYWQYHFTFEAPVFRFYPVYFVLLEALTRHFVIHHSERWSLEEHRFLEKIVDSWWFAGWIWAGLVVVSLFMTRHYLIYPIAVGLLTVRCALAMALKRA